MKVKDHKKFARFKYTSSTSTKLNLGDVVKKVSEDGTEIGVILQIHSENEFRTDMFGNGYIDEITMANREDVKAFRPDLLKYLQD